MVVEPTMPTTVMLVEVLFPADPDDHVPHGVT